MSILSPGYKVIGFAGGLIKDRSFKIGYSKFTLAKAGVKPELLPGILTPGGTAQQQRMPTRI
jgi:hypothetical protein